MIAQAKAVAKPATPTIFTVKTEFEAGEHNGKPVLSITLVDQSGNEETHHLQVKPHLTDHYLRVLNDFKFTYDADGKRIPRQIIVPTTPVPTVDNDPRGDLYIERIYPYHAFQLLENMPAQRTPVWDRVSIYAMDMLRGNWYVTTEAIGLLETGETVEAQHRLLACLLSNCPFDTIVYTKVSPEALKRLNTGRPRTITDRCEIVNVFAGPKRTDKYLKKYNTPMQRLYSIAGGHTSTLTRTDQLEGALDYWYDEIEIVNKYAYGGKEHEKNLRQPSVLAALLVGARMAKLLGQLEEYEELLYALSTYICSDALAARNKIVEDSKTKKEVVPYTFLHTYISASKKVSPVKVKEKNEFKVDGPDLVTIKCLLGLRNWFTNEGIPFGVEDAYGWVYPNEEHLTKHKKFGRLYSRRAVVNYYLGKDIEDKDSGASIGVFIPEEYIDQSQSLFKNE